MALFLDVSGSHGPRQVPDQVEERNSGTPLLLDVAATDSSNEAHVITDGLAAKEARQMPLLGFLAKSLREANFPTGLARKAGLESCAESLYSIM